ncbi:MAG: SAM-dependent methyltransferase [Saccharospirillum sp.]
MKTRLSKRLRTLFDAIPVGYDSVWDLCCDHGRLGMAILETAKSPQVVFVDQIPEITDGVESLLQRYGAKGYQVECQDARTLNLPEQGRHLLVLAGVGDEVTLSIMTGLLNRGASDARFDWLVSPANNLFQVREQLRQWPLSVLKEGFVMDKQRGYEWLLLQHSETPNHPVSNPAPFWDASLPEHSQHLQKLRRHALKQRQNPAQREQADQALQLLDTLLP